MTNDIVTNIVPVSSHLTPQQAAMTLREWIGAASILAMAIIHAYQIIVNAGGVRTIVKNFLGPKQTTSVEPVKTNV